MSGVARRCANVFRENEIYESSGPFVHEILFATAQTLLSTLESAYAGRTARGINANCVISK